MIGDISKKGPGLSLAPFSIEGHYMLPTSPSVAVTTMSKLYMDRTEKYVTNLSNELDESVDNRSTRPQIDAVRIERIIRSHG